MVATPPTLTLSNGNKMPIAGLGTWQTDNQELAETAIEAAIEAGYRLIDTAALYGNEQYVGNVLKKLFDSGKLHREDIFITTKVWSTNLHPDRQEGSVKESLRKLQVEYVDLLLAHMPTVLEADGKTQDHSVKVEDIWRGMERFYNRGLARAIGVSNWSVEQMERVRKIAKIPIHNTQNEIHIFFPQEKLVDYCKQHNITVTSYASIGSPGRIVKSVGGTNFDWEESPDMFAVPEVVELSKKYNKTPAQILLRYLIDRDIIVVPKSSNANRVKENISIFDFKLTPEEVDRLNHNKHRQILFVQHHMIGNPEDGLKEFRAWAH